jgi:hypothetical protein
MVNKNQVWDWYQLGIKKISDLREEHLERAVLQKVREALQTNAPVIDRRAIRSFLNEIKQPFLVMDMEVFSPARTLFTGYRALFSNSVSGQF